MRAQGRAYEDDVRRTRNGEGIKERRKEKKKKG